MSEIHTMVGAYATDALTESEQHRFEEHLVGCEPCQREVQEFRDTLARLGPLHAVPPPAELRDAVLGRIGSVRVLPPGDESPDEPTDTVERRADAPVIRPRRWAQRALLAAAAVSLVVNIALGATVIQQQQDRQHSDQLARAESEARTELMTASDLRVHAASMADGTPVSYFVSASRGRALLVASALRRPQEGRAWQLWTIHGSEARSAGLLSTGGEVHVWVDGIAGAQTIALTDEPSGGSDRPTTTPQAAVTLG